MAVLSQERHIELVSGTEEAFVITTLMVSATIPAQLPHLSVFVHRVVDTVDPKQDVFTRVARVSDLTLLPIGRAAGIAMPQAEGMVYLSTAVTNSYADLETAQAAATAVQDRVNALIEAWVKVQTSFAAAGPATALYTLPRGSASQSEALIAAYKLAKQDRYTKQLAKTEADAALARAVADSAYRAALHTTIQPIEDDADGVTPEVGILGDNFAALYFAGVAFHAANTGDAEAVTFAAALNVAAIAQSAAGTYAAHAAALAADLGTYTGARATDALTATTTVAASQTAATLAAQQLVSAQGVESAALAGVLAVCPDFDRHSVPFVDDSEP